MTILSDSPPAPAPAPEPDGRGAPGSPEASAKADGWSIGVFVLAAMAMILSLFGVGLGIRAVNESGSGGSSSSASSGSTSAPVTATTVHLSEFKIEPGQVDATTGAGIDVMNMGTTAHNLAVEGSSVASPMIDAGKTGHLDLSSLKPGTYTLVCQVPGHKEAGMTAALNLKEGPKPAGAGAEGVTVTEHQTSDMDTVMAKSTEAFPAKTEGLGAQLLAPTVLADGTKQFDLTSKVVKWEVEPGRKVDAWTYNGTVPGPTIRVNPGDKVKVVLHNELPESTVIHFHGLEVPNSQDGVPYITQDPIKTGTTFTYSFTAQSTPAVGMYHSHFDAAKQVANGLAGAFLVGEEPVPSGTVVSQETTMMLNDTGTIGFSLNGKSFPATAPIVAKLGDWVEVHYMNEGVMAHPMHLHGLAQLVIAKDGFPVPQPYQADTVLVAPGERYTVLVHADSPGTWAWHCHILTHAERDDGMFGMVTALVVK
jgi:FtsP/CotA-like multicopper oxidase with cupredoxin domain